MHELADLGDDVRAVVRRFGFRSGPGHPADKVDDSRLLAAGVLASIAKLDGDANAEAYARIALECRATFRCSEHEATDIATFGRWLAAQNASPDEALRRLSRRLIKVSSYHDRAQLAQDLERMATAVATAQDGETISTTKQHAIEQLRKQLADR